MFERTSSRMCSLINAIFSFILQDMMVTTLEDQLHHGECDPDLDAIESALNCSDHDPA